MKSESLFEYPTPTVKNLITKNAAFLNIRYRTSDCGTPAFAADKGVVPEPNIELDYSQTTFTN